MGSCFIQLVDVFHRLFIFHSVTNEITTHRDAGATNAAPTVDVDVSAFIQRFIHGIQNVNHSFARRGVVIANGEAMILRIDFVSMGLFLENDFVRCVFAGLSEIEESVDTRFQKLVDAAASDFRVVIAGVFTGKETIFLHPVGFDDGKFGHKVFLFHPQNNLRMEFGFY